MAEKTVRFEMVISEADREKLDSAARERGISRAEYIRRRLFTPEEELLEVVRKVLCQHANEIREGV